ncbi:MAG: hypothetical protein OHK0013_22030 [Sandaracinaceae bacterium]
MIGTLVRTGLWAWALVATFVLADVGAPTVAAAQRASEAVLAREQFRAGVQAAQEERWHDAADAFQRSYELSPRPLTLLNLAGAYAQTGRLVEAVEAYRMFLMERQGVSARMRADAEAQLADIEPRVPRARISVLGIQEGDVVRLDEYELSTASLEQPLPVNPGAHTVALEREGHEPIVVTFEGRESDVTAVLVDARAPEPAPDERGTTGLGRGSVAPPSPGRSIVEEPAFWIVVGSVLVAGGVVTGVVLGTQSAPTVGNLPPGQIAID